MKLTLNITKDNFEYIDFSESLLFVDANQSMKGYFSFYVHGVTILNGPVWSGDKYIHRFEPDLFFLFEKHKTFDNLKNEHHYQSFYVSGKSKIEFHYAEFGKLVVSLYDENNPERFYHSSNSDQIYVKKEWNSSKSNDELFEYWIQAPIHWSFGYSDFKVFSNGSVTMTFKEEDCVSSKEFIKNPDRYKF